MKIYESGDIVCVNEKIGVVLHCSHSYMTVDFGEYTRQVDYWLAERGAYGETLDK